MNIKKLIKESLLLEGRIENARLKYPQFSDEIFNFYVNNDPSGNQKYLSWLLKATLIDSRQYDRVNVFSRDYHNQIINAINFFHENSPRFTVKDINKYDDLSELERAIEGVKLKRTRREEKLEGATKIYDDVNLSVVVPLTVKGSCIYGSNTKWCVSATEGNLFTNYNKDGNLFFILWKLKMPEHLGQYQKIARYIPHGYQYETEGEYFTNTDTRMEGSDIESMLFGVRRYYNSTLGIDITDIPENTKKVYNSWESAKIAIDTYYAKNGMNLPRNRELDDINESTSTFSHSRGSYIAPMRPGLRLFDPEQLKPYTVGVSKYNSALLNYDSYDGKMDEPKKTIKKLERQAKKASEYAKKHPTQSGEDGDVINPYPSKKPLKENEDFGSDDIRLSGHKGFSGNVFVHRNLNKPPYWSIRNKSTNLVIGYDKTLWLTNVTFVVQEAGKNKVRRVKQKNVHAGITGIIKHSGGDYDTTGWTLVTYNPYINDTFVEFETGKPVYRANEVILKNVKEVWVR